MNKNKTLLIVLGIAVLVSSALFASGIFKTRPIQSQAFGYGNCQKDYKECQESCKKSNNWLRNILGLTGACLDACNRDFRACLRGANPDQILP